MDFYKSVAQTHLFGLLLADVCPSQHGGLDGREDLQLSADGGDSFTDLLEHKHSEYLAGFFSGYR